MIFLRRHLKLISSASSLTGLTSTYCVTEDHSSHWRFLTLSLNSRSKPALASVITSRTSFWNTNLPEIELDAFVKKHGALIFKLRPFDLEHAKNYFLID